MLSESEYFAGIPPVDTVTRLPAPKSETPAAVTVIDRDTIRVSGVRNLADIFRLVPGFQVIYIRSHRPAVTYHGLGDQYSRRMQILIDGRSVYNALFGNVSWSSLPVSIDDIERIEIVRGPNAAAYGANAFLGTVNIITRHSVQMHEDGLLKSNTGTDGIRDVTAGLTERYGNGGMRLTAGYNQDNGLQGIPDGSESRYVNVRSDWQPGVPDTILFQAGYIRQHSMEGIYNNIFSPPSSSTTDAWFGQIRWQRQFSANNELRLQFYHNNHDFKFNYLTGPVELGPVFGTVRVPVSFDSTVERNDLELQQVFSSSVNRRYVWGFGVRRDIARSLPHFASDETLETESARVFGNAEWRISSGLILNAGAMWENTDFTDAELSPRVALNYHLNADHTLRAAWSRAQRIPSLFEEYADRRYMVDGFLFEHQFESAGDLQPESMLSTELGYFGRFHRLNATLDVRLYRDRIDDFITEEFVPVTDVLDGRAISFRNEGHVDVEGMDIEVTCELVSNLNIAFNYARMFAEGSEVPADTPANQRNRLASVPDYSASLMIIYRLTENWDNSISYYKSDDILWLSDGDALPAHERVDLRIAYRFQPGEIQGELALVIQNAGRSYDEFRENQFFERRAFLTLGLAF